MTDKIDDYAVITVPIEALKPFKNHARKHDPQKAKSLARAIRQMDLVDPIIIDENHVILSGHLRVQVFKQLQRSTIPAIQVTHLGPQEKRAFVIAANRFPERGNWDRELLTLEVSEILELAPELEIEVTGFEVPEVDLMLIDDQADGLDACDRDIPEPSPNPVSKPGDLWLLGDHRVFCGSCLEPTSWAILMGNERARLCITDPPYNVPIKGHVSSKGHSEFAMASGEMTSDAFIEFLDQGLGLAAQYSCDGALHFIAMDHRHIRELMAAADPHYSRQLNLIVWNKTNAGMGSFYRSRHELFFLYKVGTNEHVNHVQLGRYGRNRSNIWTYPGSNAFGSARDDDLTDHPTVKPTLMLMDAIRDASDRGDIVLDGFAGSGSLVLAAEKTGRQARVIELDPGYVDVIIKRWTRLTGGTPRLVSSRACPALPPPPAESQIGGVS